MPSGTSMRARCWPASRGSSTISTVRRWPCSRRRSSASAGSPRGRRISRWRAPARPPRACRCWPFGRASRSTRRDRPTARRPPSRRPGRAASWRASTPGSACGRHATRATRRLRASSLSTCRRRPRATGDSARARTLLYSLLTRDPLSDDAAAGVGLALGPLPPHAPDEHVAMARALNRRASVRDARIHVEHALRAGDSTAVAALSGFADRYPTDTAAPGALYILGDLHDSRDDWGQAGRWYGELIKRYPADARASLARFRLAARAEATSNPDSAASLYQSEIDAAGPQRTAARFWLGKMADARGDAEQARRIWLALAHEDSLGYYGMRARRETGLPPLAFSAPVVTTTPPALVSAGLARIDTLLLAGLDTEAQAEVRVVLARPPADLDALLAWSEGLGLRGYGSAGVRLGWQAALLAPGDTRVLRAIFPWPNRAAVEAEAQEFGVDALLLAALVRQESVFDVEALSPAGARGLAQLLPSTASLMARGLDVTFYPEWITVPDLNLHLGAAHLAELLKRFGRVDAAIAAYNAGPSPVRRWLDRAGATDPDRFIELIPYPETRGYVRSLLRNRELYRALYEP